MEFNQVKQNIIQLNTALVWIYELFPMSQRTLNLSFGFTELFPMNQRTLDSWYVRILWTNSFPMRQRKQHSIWKKKGFLKLWKQPVAGSRVSCGRRQAAAQISVENLPRKQQPPPPAHSSISAAFFWPFWICGRTRNARISTTGMCSSIAETNEETHQWTAKGFFLSFFFPSFRPRRRPFVTKERFWLSLASGGFLGLLRQKSSVIHLAHNWARDRRAHQRGDEREER